MALRWENQASCVNLNFTLPWQQCMWQPSRQLCAIQLRNDATPRKSSLQIAKKATPSSLQIAKKATPDCKEAMSTKLTPSSIMPDGVCPVPLITLLVALGTSTTQSRELVLTCARATLMTTWRLSEVHKTWKIHHLQLLGLPLLGVGDIQSPDTTRCPLCEEEWRHLYRVHARSPSQKEAHETLLEQLLITHTLRQEQYQNNGQTVPKTIANCKAVWQDVLQKRDTADRSSGIREFANRLYNWGACVCILCAVPILSKRQMEDNESKILRAVGSTVTTPGNSALPSRNNSGCSNTSFVTDTEEQLCSLSKHQWQRLTSAPQACPKIVDKNLVAVLNKKQGAARVILTEAQMNLLGLRHLCWDAYIEVGDYFYRPSLPPILKQGLMQEMRRIGIDPSTENMTLTRVSALTARNIDLAWR